MPPTTPPINATLSDVGEGSMTAIVVDPDPVVMLIAFEVVGLLVDDELDAIETSNSVADDIVGDVELDGGNSVGVAGGCVVGGAVD